MVFCYGSLSALTECYRILRPESQGHTSETHEKYSHSNKKHIEDVAVYEKDMCKLTYT